MKFLPFQWRSMNEWLDSALNLLKFTHHAGLRRIDPLFYELFPE